MKESKNIWHILSFAAVVSVLVFAVPAAGYAASIDSVLNYKGADRAKFLEEGAKKEGKLTVYSSLTVGHALRPIIKAFQKRYPFIDAKFWRGGSSKILQKVLAEMRANSLAVDVIESAGITGHMVKIKKLEKFYTPASKAIPQKFRPNNGLWLPSRFSYVGLGYNTKIIAPGTQPKTFKDLLDPKWKGKLAWRSNSPTGDIGFVTNILITMGDQQGEAYLKKLSRQKVVNFNGSIRTLLNRVIEGEYPVAITVYLHHAVISADKGAPVAPQFLKPVATFAGTVMIPKGVKNPYATMLFIDFYLSKEGQNVLRKAKYFPANPNVKPQKALQKVSPIITGVKANFIDPMAMDNYNDKARAIIKKYFR